MTTQELEEQLLRLPPADKLHLIQVLAQSLNVLWIKDPQTPANKLSDFFRQSPLCEAMEMGKLELSRDRSLAGDRFVP